MASGNIRQSFYRERSVPFLHSLPPPSRIPPRSDFSAGLPIFKVFFFFSYLEKPTERGHIPLLQVQGGQPFPEDLLKGSGAKGTIHPASEMSRHALIKSEHFSPIYPMEVRQSQP